MKVIAPVLACLMWSQDIGWCHNHLELHYKHCPCLKKHLHLRGASLQKSRMDHCFISYSQNWLITHKHPSNRLLSKEIRLCSKTGQSWDCTTQQRQPCNKEPGHLNPAGTGGGWGRDNRGGCCASGGRRVCWAGGALLERPSPVNRRGLVHRR